jgi:hypothetical protein
VGSEATQSGRSEVEYADAAISWNDSISAMLQKIMHSLDDFIGVTFESHRLLRNISGSFSLHNLHHHYLQFADCKSRSVNVVFLTCRYNKVQVGERKVKKAKHFLTNI